MEYRQIYDKDRHEKFETKTRETFEEIFKNAINAKKIEEKEKYTYDMKVEYEKHNKKHILLLEFETRKDKDFNNIKNRVYPNIHIPVRKMINGNISNEYIVTNLSCTDFFVTRMKNIKESFKKDEIDKNRQVKSGKNNEIETDSFVCIGYEKFSHFKVIRNNNNEAIKIEKQRDWKLLK